MLEAAATDSAMPRTQSGEQASPRRRSRVPLLLVLLLAIEAVALPLAVKLADRSHGLAHLVETLRWMTVGTFVGAGVVRLSRARLAADARRTATGIAYLIMALGYPLSQSLAPLHSDDESELLAPLMRMTCFLVAIAIFYAATARAPTNLQPRRILVLSGAVIGGTQAALLIVRALIQRPLDPPLVAFVGMQVALGVGWLVVAERARRTSRSDRDAGWALAVLPLALFGLADLLRAFAAVDLLPWLLTSGAIRLTGGAVALVTGTIWFQQTVSQEIARRSSVERALAATERFMTGSERQVSQQRHEASSIIFGIHLAWSALQNYGDDIPDETRDRLRAQGLQELTRLQDLINAPAAASVRLVRLRDALAPAVAAVQVGARAADIELDHSVVWANEEDLRTVVLTLVAAAVRPPNGTVRLRTTASDGYVDLIIEPITGKRAARRYDADGGSSVIGYSTCQRLVDAMHGELTQDASGEFVLRLRAVSADELEAASL